MRQPLALSADGGGGVGPFRDGQELVPEVQGKQVDRQWLTMPCLSFSSDLRELTRPRVSRHAEYL